MSINLSTEDMLHIVELLREDLICSRQVLSEEPDNIEASGSMTRSQAIMLKVAAFAILKGYTLDEVNDNPNYIQSRSRLN